MLRQLRKVSLAISVTFFMLFGAVQLKAAELTEQMKPFAAYIGTWESTFAMGKDKDGNPIMVTDVARWEETLNGTTIRTLHSINDGAYGGESLMFWDAKTSKTVFYYFTSAGFYTSGSLEWEGENKFAAYEDVEASSQGMASGITKVKSISELKGEKILVSTSYLKNGKWTTPETREYNRSTKSVKFK